LDQGKGLDCLTQQISLRNRVILQIVANYKPVKCEFVNMDKSSRKLFAGAQMRNLRNTENLSQKECAMRLGISPSYLNQIENNQRPLTAAVILALVEEFKADISKFTQRLSIQPRAVGPVQ